MKKLLLSTVCITALGLSACDKTQKTEADTNATQTTNSSPTALSHDNVSDIRSDLDAIQTLSNSKAQEALKFQTDVTQAAQKGDKAALDQVVKSMDQYVDDFNDALDDLKLKSAEGISLKDKMKEANELGLDLAEEGVKMPPDNNKVMELQNKSTQLQQELLKEMQALQNKVAAQ